MPARTLLAVLALLFTVNAAAQDTAGTGIIRGTVVDAGAMPAAGIAICVTVTGQCAVTGADGRFSIAGVRAGTYQLEIVAPGQPPIVSDPVQVRAGLDGIIEVTLPRTEGFASSVTVTAPAFVPPDEVKSSSFLVSAEQIAKSAGALQDVSRYVQSLPGAVIGTDDFRNDLIVRGGSPLENLFIVDNIEIPNINTFANFASAGGTVSILDAQLIEDVTFLTGGYPAPYINRTSSVLQIAQREGSRERTAARATLGFAGAGLIAEGPLSPSARDPGSCRRAAASSTCSPTTPASAACRCSTRQREGRLRPVAARPRVGRQPDRHGRGPPRPHRGQRSVGRPEHLRHQLRWLAVSRPASTGSASTARAASGCSA
jgi:hypothetical protein